MNRILEKGKKAPSQLIYALIALLSLAFMSWQCDKYSLWADEFAQICYSGLDKSLLDSALIVDPTPPLFNVLANVWYDITPYGDRWLLLLPQLAVALAVYVAGCWGEMMGGRRVGIWTAMLLGSSRMVIAHCGFEFRGYGVYLLFAVLTLYNHGKLLERGCGAFGKYAFFYWFSLLGLVYSHAFGSLMFFVLAGLDIILVLCRRLSWRMIAVYFCAGILFLPWVFYFFSQTGSRVVNAESGWMRTPNTSSIPRLVAYLCGNHVLTCVLFALAALFILWKLAEAVKKREWDAELIHKMVPFVVTAGVIMVVFMYSVIRPHVRSFWVERYFTGLFSCAMAACALGADALCTLLERKSVRAARIGGSLCALAIVSVFLGRLLMEDIPMVKFYHKESTEIMYQQPDIRDEGVIILCSSTAYLEGWEEYYCEQKGAREGLSLHSLRKTPWEEISACDVVYFDYNFWYNGLMEEKNGLLLEENYELDKAWDEARLRRYVKKQ